MWYSKYVPAACLLAILLATPAAGSNPPEMILGPGGQLQRALAGAYGELFAAGDPTAPATPVLAIEIGSGNDAERLLVPGTDDARIETDPRLFRDPRSDTFVLLWKSRAEGGDAELAFATFDGAEWSEVFRLERDGEPVPVAGAPLIAETHDFFELELEGEEPIRATRMVVHLLWHEGEEQPATHYAPLPFVEGRYVGWHGYFVLSDEFLSAPEPAADDTDTGDSDDETDPSPEPVALTAALARTLELRAAADGRSVLATFANLASQRIGSLEISPLPLELALLGDQVRDQVLENVDLYDPDDLSSFSDAMRAGIVIIGLHFDMHGAHAGYVADQVADWLLESGDAYGWGGLESLGDDARDLAVDVSQEVYLSTDVDAADPDSEIVRLDVSGLFDGQDSGPAQVFDFRTRADLPAPAAAEAEVRVFTSPRGGDLLIAWEVPEEGEIRWLESRAHRDGGAWSEVFGLPVSEQLSLEAAHRLLAKRLR